MLNGGWGQRSTASAIQHRNAMLEELEAVDVASVSPEQLGVGIKFLSSTADLVELQKARWVAEFDRR